MLQEVQITLQCGHILTLAVVWPLHILGPGYQDADFHSRFYLNESWIPYSSNAPSHPQTDVGESRLNFWSHFPSD